MPKVPTGMPAQTATGEPLSRVGTRRRARAIARQAWRTRGRLTALFLVLALALQLAPVSSLTKASAAVETSSVKLFFPDMHSRLGAKILTTVTTVGASRMRVTVTGPNYSEVLADIPAPTTPDAHVATLNLRNLVAGTYTITADVTNSSGTLIAQKARTFNKAISGAPRVGFDENNALYVDGKLVPVVGTWWGNYAGSWSPQYLPSLKQAGRITTAEVIDGARSSSTWANALDQSAANGITAIGPTIAGQSDITNIVNTSKGKSALLAWMWMDEPEYHNTSAATVRNWTDQTHALDPHHPVMTNLVGPMFVNQGGSQATSRSFTSDLINAEKNAAVDWFSSDYYPIAFSPNFGMSRQTAYDRFAEHLTNLRSFTKDLYPLKTFIEVGSMPELNSSTVPKPNEVWAQVWIAVAKGVRSISWFPVDSTGSAVTDPGIPAMQAKATSYLTRYTPMLAQADSKKVSRTHVSGSGRVDYIAKEYNGKLYVFAVNRDTSGSASVRFDLSQFSASSVSVYDENRTIALSGNSFTDSFVPYGVHIYEISGTGTTTPPATPAPTGTMSVNNGASSTSSTSVSVNSAVSNAAEMRIDPGTGTFGAWAAYASSASIALPAGDGTKTVRAEYRNSGGTLALSDTITLTTPVTPAPVAAPTGTMSVNNGAPSTSSAIVTVNSAVTNASEMRIDPGTGTFGAWAAYASAASVTLPAGDGTKTVRAEYRNSGGTLALSDTITLTSPVVTPPTTSAPTGWFTINNGAAQTNSSLVTIQNYVTGATQMRFATNGTYGAWMNYATASTLQLPFGDGTKPVAAQYADAAGNVLTQNTFIVLDTAAPTGWFTINSGAAQTSSTSVGIQNYVTGATRMRFATGGSYGPWVAYAANHTLTLPSGDGTKYVAAQYADAAGNVLTQNTSIRLATSTVRRSSWWY